MNPNTATHRPGAAPSQAGTPVRGPQYVVVEGVIGAGKTTLARMLAEQHGGRLVLEAFEDNPFLARFYADRSRWAFQTQLAFLASRFRQQKQLLTRDLFDTLVVSDYAFDKDRIFAHLNLTGDELQLYETLYTLMEPATPTPDLVVYLRSSVERLLHNIARRARSYEAEMEPAYIAALHDAYEYYFRRYRKSPLLVVEAAEVDFVADARVRGELLRQVMTTTHDGTRYLDLATPGAPSH